MFPRRQKLNIDGVWFFTPDFSQQGEEKKWYLNLPQTNTQQIVLPLTQPLDIDTKPPVLWFFKEFEIPDIEQNSNIFLYLQNINYKSVIWLNGHYLGTHEGAFTKFSFDITRQIRTGKNILAIKVYPFSSNPNPNFPVIYNPSWIHFPGIWGSSYIEFAPQNYIKNFQVRPDVRGKRVVTNIYVNNKNCTLRVKIPELDAQIQSKKPKLTLQLKDFEPWLPPSPKLYTIQIEYITESSSDYAEVQFGMRDFSVNENQFILNYKPFYVKALLFHWKLEQINTSLYSEEKLRELLTKLHECNFNLILPYGQPLPEKIIRICDEIGLMVAETPSLHCDTKNKKHKEVAIKEIEEILSNKINNPSFVWFQCEYFSEQFYVSNLIRDIRKTDRSRLITVYPSYMNSNLPSYYFVPYNIKPLPIKHIYSDFYEYLNNTSATFLEHTGKEDSLNFVIPNKTQPTESQVLSEGNNEQNYKSKIEEAFKERNLDISFGSIENFLEQIKDVCIHNINSHVNFVLSNPHISGYCIYPEKLVNILNLSENHLNQLKRINQPVRLAIAYEKTNLIENEEIIIKVFLIPQGYESSVVNTENKLSLTLSISSPTQQILWKKKREFRFKKESPNIWLGDITGSKNIGIHTLTTRVSLNNKILSEFSHPFTVLPKPEDTNIPVKFIDIQNQFSKICSEWVKQPSNFPPIYIIPPIYNTVFAYPEIELIFMMEQVRHGAIGIIFSPPDDWNELSEFIPNCPQFASFDISSPDKFRHFHYVKPHPIFLNLPNRCLMKQEYRNIVPSKVFLEKGDEDICGCLIIPQEKNKEPFWGTDILVHRYGVGKLVFVHLKVLENIPNDPVAIHLFVNMVNYFARRAIPSHEEIPIPLSIVQKIRLQKEENLRKWMVIGEFPIIGEDNEALYPNAESIDLTATYHGKYQEISWKPYYTIKKKHHNLDFYKALSIPLHPHYSSQESGIVFAYAEFNYEDKEEVIVQLQTSNAFQLWLNGNKILENLNPASEVKNYEAKTVLHKWKNLILIKLIKEKGNYSFNINFFDKNRKQLDINW